MRAVLRCMSKADPTGYLAWLTGEGRMVTFYRQVPFENGTLVLAMISELSEVLDEVNFKWWKNPKPVDEDALKNELVDVLHFFVSMCLKSGMTAEELFSRYQQKNQENFDRQYGRSQKNGYEAQ